MRDPKAHIKVLTLRRLRMLDHLAEAEMGQQFDRFERIHDLVLKLNQIMDDYEKGTGWIYNPWRRVWRHVEIIPDTEEN